MKEAQKQVFNTIPLCDTKSRHQCLLIKEFGGAYYFFFHIFSSKVSKKTSSSVF